MPLTKILEVELSNIMGPFPPSYSNKHILVVVIYIYKWVELVVILSNNFISFIKLLRNNIFTHFYIPKLSLLMEISIYVIIF